MTFIDDWEDVMLTNAELEAAITAAEDWPAGTSTDLWAVPPSGDYADHDDGPDLSDPNMASDCVRKKGYRP